MGNTCKICGIRTLFHTWTTSRDFPIEEFMKTTGLESKGDRLSIKYTGYPVCFSCLEKLRNKNE